ncbi:hypothetical protein EYF80_032711 [Liparis tanakae]|uniref:Uncharacterized protein n=1 Tax=Liparis tanakae TaxID=230148 RepID=A0A4Z2GUB9_9TELE|nr:hypothetical protein EYF80_032711 [Liparis tanakae]
MAPTPALWALLRWTCRPVASRMPSFTEMERWENDAIRSSFQPVGGFKRSVRGETNEDVPEDGDTRSASTRRDITHSLRQTDNRSCRRGRSHDSPARSRMTWSSRASSEKWGILLAHSTSVNSCLSAAWQMLVTGSLG